MVQKIWTSATKLMGSTYLISSKQPWKQGSVSRVLCSQVFSAGELRKLGWPELRQVKRGWFLFSFFSSLIRLLIRRKRPKEYGKRERKGPGHKHKEQEENVVGEKVLLNRFRRRRSIERRIQRLFDRRIDATNLLFLLFGYSRSNHLLGR